jgi:hypothetical protein
MDNVLSVSEFRTDSLHKYMKPVYAEMNLHLFDSDDMKKSLLPKLFPMFFHRLRKYRDIDLEQISTKYRIPLERLRLFEVGQLKMDREIQEAYLSECGGHAEVMVFERQIREFQNPSFKNSRFDHARMAARVGLVIPGLDYKNLNPEGASVLPFSRREAREH